MMLGVDGDLDIVADNAGTAAARRHRAEIGIGQQNAWSGVASIFILRIFETLHLLLQLLDLFFQAARLGLERLGRLLPVGSVELLQIARDALLDLRHASVHLGAREVLIAVVHRLELAAVDRDAGFREQAHCAAQRDEACAHFADGSTIVPTEIGNGLVVKETSPAVSHMTSTLRPASRSSRRLD